MPGQIIAVVGTSDPGQTDACQAAERVGRLLAEQGAILVCGGLSGVMEHACRGAQSAGGITVGLLPGASRAEGNPHLTVALATGLGEMRNALIVRASDAVIAIGGGWGTLAEVALAARTGVPVFGLNTWTVTPPVPVATPGVEVVQSAEAAVAGALAAPMRDRGA